MRYPMGSLDEQLKGGLETIEEALGKLEDPTRELVDAPRALIPFTGYYGLNTAAGAFFSIDTTELYVNSPRPQIPLSQPIIKTIIKINVSLDGCTCASYDFDSSHASFDGQTLLIPDVLKVHLARGYKGGQLVTVSGMIGARTVSGSTYFNPVELPVFAGTYKDKYNEPRLVVAESSLQFDSGKGLQDIPVFAYIPAMYVVQFETDAHVKYLLMLGTAAENGLGCVITNDKNDLGFVSTISKR